MKRDLEQGSKWPLQPLDEEIRAKDVEEALVFGNHKGAIQQQDLLKKLVTDNVVRGFALPLPLDKITQIPGVLLTDVGPLFNLGTQHDGRSTRTWMKRV